MNITRHKRPDIGWTTISQTVFDADLSGEALGILCYLLSRPDSWVVRTAHLQKKFRRGPDKIRTLINEIISAGFIQRERRSQVRGRFVTPKTFVTDLPHTDLSGSIENGV
jgi:hypothetical protein